MQGTSPDTLSGPALLQEVTSLDLREDIENLQRDIGLYTRLKGEATTDEERNFLYQMIWEAMHLLKKYYEELKK